MRYIIKQFSKLIDNIILQGDISKAQESIRFFYYYLLLISYESLTHILSLESLKNIDPLWPIQWINISGIYPGIRIIILGFTLGSLLTAILPGSRTLRALTFTALLMYVASLYASSKIDHDFHLLILVSFILIFLPNDWNKKLEIYNLKNKQTLLIFLGCQGIVLATYTLSGFWKLFALMEQLLKGEVHLLIPQSVALHISQQLLRSKGDSILGPWVIDNYIVAWPFFIGILCLEIFSLVILFKPSLYKPWAILLIIFHISTYLTMNIIFLHNVIILSILFLSSPFSAKKSGLFKDIPILSFIIRRLAKFT